MWRPGGSYFGEHLGLGRVGPAAAVWSLLGLGRSVGSGSRVAGLVACLGPFWGVCRSGRLFGSVFGLPAFGLFGSRWGSFGICLGWGVPLSLCFPWYGEW